MKKLIAVLSIIGALAVGACSESDAVVSKTDTASKTDIALEVIRDEYPVLTANLSDEILISTMHNTCEYFDNGADSNDWIDLVLTSSGGDPDLRDLLAFTSGVGVGVFCPEHQHIFGG